MLFSVGCAFGMVQQRSNEQFFLMKIANNCKSVDLYTMLEVCTSDIAILYALTNRISNCCWSFDYTCRPFERTQGWGNSLAYSPLATGNSRWRVTLKYHSLFWRPVLICQVDWAFVTFSKGLPHSNTVKIVTVNVTRNTVYIRWRIGRGAISLAE